MTTVSNKVYKGDVGTSIILRTGSVLTDAAVSMKVKKPSGAEVIWDAVVISVSGTDQGIKHITQEGDLDEYGTYKIQGYVVLPEWKGRTTTVNLRVWEVFE